MFADRRHPDRWGVVMLAIKKTELTLEEELALARADIIAGRATEAIERLEHLIETSTFLPALHYWLSAAHGRAGDSDKQVEALRRAQTFESLQIIKTAGGDLVRLQQDPAYAAQVGVELYAACMMGPASTALGSAAADPEMAPQVLLNYGLALQHQGRIEEAVAAFTTGAEGYNSPVAHAFLLYACFFAEDGVRVHAEEARRWAALHTPTLDLEALAFANARDPGKRLRIGYVVPTFVGAQSRQFIVPVLEAHDPEAVEVFLYAADAAREGELPVAAIRSIGALTDQEAAELIREDGVDVLVDLWGHTAGGRLGMFALKPAPVQVSWINYQQTTGVPAMDYVIHGECMDAPGTEELFTESIWRLPIPAPFRPDPEMGPSPAPALRNGFVTFGSFNHPARLTDQTLAAWARILKAVPNSQLVLKYRYFTDAVLKNTVCARFAAHGVDPVRLDFRGHTTGEEYISAFADIDLALDPSPCPGGTTTCDALANGVPVLTLKGADFYSRIGMVCPQAMGMDELIASSWDDYVDRAVALASDVGALAALRATVRPSLDASLVRDEAGVTRMLENAFREMFARWSRGA